MLLGGHKISTRQCQEEFDVGIANTKYRDATENSRVQVYILSGSLDLSLNQKCCEFRPKLSSTQDSLLVLSIV